MEDVQAYPWNVSTKYYTAQVALCTAPSRTIGDKAFAERVEAFVVHFDSTKVLHVLYFNGLVFFDKYDILVYI